MYIFIKLDCSEKNIKYKIIPRNKWYLHRSPIQFRRLNSHNIDSLGKVLEKIGFIITKEQFPDINLYDYYAYFHPIINEGMLKKIDDHLKEKNT
jgi:hypothetical protein